MDIDWKYIMLVSAVIDLMFTLYLKIRENPQFHASINFNIMQELV